MHVNQIGFGVELTYLTEDALQNDRVQVGSVRCRCFKRQTFFQKLIFNEWNSLCLYWLQLKEVACKYNLQEMRL